MIGGDEKDFIRGGLKADIRSDGRACNDSRHLSLSVGDLQQCSGSARCTMGSTDVIVGVKVYENLNATPMTSMCPGHGWCQHQHFACRPNWGRLYQIHQTVEECKSQWSVVPVQGQHLRSAGMMQYCSFESQQAWGLRGVLQQLQGRAGEALSFELAKSLERSLNAHPSGSGMPRLVMLKPSNRTLASLL